MSIQDFLDSCGDGIDLHDSFTISWSMKGVGFGQYRFYNDDEGQLHIDNECMSKESIKRVLEIMVDNAVLDDPMLQTSSEENSDEGG